MRPSNVVIPIMLFLSAGKMLLLFFILLAGVRHHGVLQRLYFLEAVTSGIQNAGPITRWSFYGICSYNGSDLGSLGSLIACTPHRGDYAFDPVRNFETTMNIPHNFVQHQNRLFYESRFQYPFYLIAMAFQVGTLVTAALSVRWPRFVTSTAVLETLSFAMLAIAASLTTTVYTTGRNWWKQAGRNAKLGQIMFAFSWTVLFMTILNAILSWAVSLTVRMRQHRYVNNRVPPQPQQRFSDYIRQTLESMSPASSNNSN